MAHVRAGTDLSPLQRSGGGFAMLAVDQREAMRNMFAEHTAEPVTDQDLQDFKVAAARILTPYASAVLVDKQFAFDAVVDQHAVADGCGLIAAADHFESANGELVGRVTIDPQVVPARVKEQGAVALKLLVLWREDEPAGPRVSMVEQFVDLCRNTGLISIIEPVSRGRADRRPSDTEAGVLAAARELGRLGADLYKAEVPLKGQGDQAEIRRRCAEITAAVDSPWVVLSSGVPQDLFPEAVRTAMSEGANGFLAGRAVWASCIGAADVEQQLREAAVQRLQNLAAIVDEQMAART
ncbi:putative aldolase [Microlunatus phosphovorus NM-1]|uniref:Putative aldolase n=1 Tax=Microlunatus phosphovorus (strain ATCC 700054 / DSM 10555 / JCM 9379 / NBRC 101784 / NCIMB 13414 / VKM Ac-1990 / NM-1) TaxID=1032480 RepID=F5XDZ2_MICPN|nr:aldolase [Microlunatus phosphovorus]BAK35165.1 putative aldolase [Microlunatus phosphovorus NM-1]